MFISFLFFLLYLSLPEESSDIIRSNNTVKVGGEKKSFEDLDEETKGLIPDSIQQQIDDSKGRVFTFGSKKYTSKAEYDSIQATLPETERDNFFIQRLYYREIEINEKYKDRKKDFNKDLSAAFLENSPKAFFFLLPIFALLLKLLYIRRDFYYSEHLVFTIYFYNFFFLAGIVSLLVELIPGMDWFSGITFLIIQVYLWIAMRKVYRQGKFKTTMKFFLLNGTFFIFMILAMAINIAIAFLQI